MIKAALHTAFLFTISFALRSGTPAKTLLEMPLSELYIQKSRSADILMFPKKADNRNRQKVYDAYYNLLPLLRKNEISIEKWFNEGNFDIIFQELTPSERNLFAQALENIGKFIESGLRDDKYIILNSAAPKILGRVNKIQFEIDSLKLQHKNMKDMAEAKHVIQYNQKYDGQGYTVHLGDVRGVLKRFGIGPKDSILGLILGSATLMHDIIEDTDYTFNDLEKDINKEQAIIVDGVTKVKKEEGMSSEVRTKLTYKKTARKLKTRILKLADRIANVEKGLKLLLSGYPSKVHKYFNEWELFYEMLYRPGEAPEMWAHLDKLLTDQDYAERYIRMLLKHEGTDIICMNYFN